MDGAESWPSRGRHEEVAPPGWYPDPSGAPVLRRWDGERWTLEDRLWPTPERRRRGPHAFNWPALAGTLMAASTLAYSRLDPDGVVTYAAAPLLFVVGLLGMHPKYGSGPGHFVAIVLAVLAGVSVCVLGLMILFAYWIW